MNEEFPDPMPFYYGKVADNDDLAWERLLISKLLLWGRENKLRLERISTTCLPQEKSGRYRTIELLKIPPNRK